MSKQKFKRASLVWVHVDPEDTSKSHFETDFFGVVRGTYHQLYGGGDRTDYSICQLNKARTKITNEIAWYQESELSLIEWDRVLGYDLMEEWDSL
jgi:hypothetical protein